MWKKFRQNFFAENIFAILVFIHRYCFHKIYRTLFNSKIFVRKTTKLTHRKNLLKFTISKTNPACKIYRHEPDRHYHAKHILKKRNIFLCVLLKSSYSSSLIPLSVLNSKSFRKIFQIWYFAKVSTARLNIIYCKNNRANIFSANNLSL